MVHLAIDQLTQIIIGCAIAVHNALGPGLLESIYRDCLVIELQHHGLVVKCEYAVPIFYRGKRIRGDLRADIVVDGRVIVEVKAIERLLPVHQAQVISYLKLTGCPAGLILNFNAVSIRAGLKRVDHPDEYAKKILRRIQPK
jgi:GxxExxY protein